MPRQHVGRFHAISRDHHGHRDRSGPQGASHPLYRVFKRPSRGCDGEIGERFVAEAAVRLWRRAVLVDHDRSGPRRGEERDGGHVLHESSTEKRVVGGIFQQATDEVGHARHELAVGHVDPHPPASGGDGQFLRIAHAVEHLHLDAPPIDAQMLGHRHAVRERPQIMAAQRRP